MDSVNFRGKNIAFTKVKGEYWIVIKTVCEALDINFNRQFQNIKEDPILGSKFAKQQTLVPGDSQPRKYICLPEKYIYGWLFSINSDSPALLEYKRECYEALFNHFHGKVISQFDLYQEISRERRKLDDFEKALADNPEYQQYLNAKMRLARLWKNARTAAVDDLFV